MLALRGILRDRQRRRWPTRRFWFSSKSWPSCIKGQRRWSRKVSRKTKSDYHQECRPARGQRLFWLLSSRWCLLELGLWWCHSSWLHWMLSRSDSRPRRGSTPRNVSSTPMDSWIICVQGPMVILLSELSIQLRYVCRNTNLVQIFQYLQIQEICDCKWFNRPKYFSGTLDAILKIGRVEGIKSLWSGLSPTLGNKVESCLNLY